MQGDGGAPSRLPPSCDVDRLRERGGTSLTLAKLNRARHEFVDDSGAIELEDGTIIPAIWNKLARLAHTYGFGAGDVTDGSR